MANEVEIATLASVVETFMEVLVRLVPAAVFKTVGLHGNHVVGGFDSHALPPKHLQQRGLHAS